MRTISLLLALVATSTLAQEGPCKADRERLCPNLAKGPARRECMKAHLAELSATCKQAVAEHRAAKKGVQPAPVSP